MVNIATARSRGNDATAWGKRYASNAAMDSPKALRVADLGDGMRSDAKKCESRPGGIRTPDQGIMSPLL